MTPEHSPPLLRHLRQLAEASRIDEASDQELVAAFASAGNEAAFGALVRRHGDMILNLCRRALGNDQDAEDAFQATFLVLARKASTLRSRDLVASWLYGVARRTALKARTARDRRSAHEASAPVPSPRDPAEELSVREAQMVVDEELAQLPEKFRAPLVLCCLEGLARDEAARQLGWSPSLVKNRLEQARELLRGRLTARGLALSSGLLSLGLLGTAQASVSPSLASATVRAAVALAGGLKTTVVSARVLTLSEGMVRAMFRETCLKVSAVVLIVGTLVAGASGAALAVRGAGTAPVAPAGATAFAPVPEPAPLPAPKGNPLAKLRPGALERWAQADIVCTALLTKVIQGPVGRSLPPVYSHTLELKIDEALRGSLKKGEVLSAFHSIRQENEPTFPEGKECVVGLKKTRGNWQVAIVEEKTADAFVQAKAACSVPLGWSVVGGQFVSPWARLGDKAWPVAAKSKSPFACGKTGRPALMAGDGVELIVEKVPPQKEVKYGNPDGDGEYKITVKNITDKRIAVPALLSDGKQVLWDDSLVILCQGKAYAIPKAQGVRIAPRPTVLKPGEAISTVVNALAIDGPEWPRGGYRIELQFALGEKSATQSFYYLSRHHDPIRARLLGGKKE